MQLNFEKGKCSNMAKNYDERSSIYKAFFKDPIKDVKRKHNPFDQQDANRTPPPPDGGRLDATEVLTEQL